MLGADDEEHIALASEQGRVIFTQDDDFLKLNAKRVDHSGIVYVRQHTPVGDIIRGLMLIYRMLEPDDMRNHVEDKGDSEKNEGKIIYEEKAANFSQKNEKEI